ncbi:MAG: GTPase domain-containing protein [Bacilli bacterium]
MRQCLVIGRPNVGKTLLCLRLAQACGLKWAFIMHELPDGAVRERVLTIREAMAILVSATRYTTVGIQTVGVGMSASIGQRMVLHDSTGLCEDSHDDELIRKGMARTLTLMVQSEQIIHVVDATALDKGVLSAIDNLILDVSRARNVHYTLVFNKIDAPGAIRQTELYRKNDRRARPVAVSALHGQGIDDMQRVLSRTNVVN